MDHDFSNDPEYREFALKIEDARRIAKGPDLFRRRSKEEDGQIWFLRRWNSHTPCFQDIWGGGCFIWWKGKGSLFAPRLEVQAHERIDRIEYIWRR